MASTGSQAQRPSLSFYLSPEQQQLLLQALASDQQQGEASAPLTSAALSSLQDNSFAATGSLSGFQDTSFFDGQDYSFGPDSSLDFDVSHTSIPNMTGELAETEPSDHSGDNDTPEKRPLEEDEGTASSKGNDAKRRDGAEKVPKKPGRKPLTSEPTSKRKAQNRAAQRAFRERKEKHLKDLENKVTELEQQSESATSENQALRQQIKSLTSELEAYKRKVQLLGQQRSVTRDRLSGGFGASAVNSLNDVQFQFEFPRFGYLPGPPMNQKPGMGRSPSSASPQPHTTSSLTSPKGHSPASVSATTPNLGGSTLQNSPNPQSDILSGLSGQRNSLDSGHYSVGSGASSSPSGSYNSLGASSSCGTSPEPFTQSPMGFKPIDTMTTIGEEQTPMSTGNGQAATSFGDLAADLSFDLFAQQNGGQFDPQLYGDYREPQSNILTGSGFDDSFFNDALDADFFTPFNTAPVMPLSSRDSLSSEMGRQQGPNKLNNTSPGATKDGDTICTQVWKEIEKCPRVQAGDFDLDGLCSELQKKAKCSGKGPEVKDQDFQAVLSKYLGPEFMEKCKENSAQHQT
jgi:AP-1-like factor